MAGAAVRGARHWAWPVRVLGAGGGVSAAPVSLAEPRSGFEPAGPRYRHPPSPGNRAHRYACDAGSGRAGAVAGATRAHAGVDQAHPRRPAVAAACDPRPLGAARAGRGADGCGLCCRGRRAHAAHLRGVRLEWRAVAGQYQGRCLGDAAALHRQATHHSFGGQQGSRCAGRGTDAGPGGQYVDCALEWRHARCRRRRRRDRGGADRAGAQGHQRAAFHDNGRWYGACPSAFRSAAMEVQRYSGPRPDHCAGERSGTSGPRFAADVLQDRG